MRSKITLSEVIREARFLHDLTLRELEIVTKISFSQLSKIERGESIPSKENIEALASALKLDVNYLLVLSGYAPKEITIGTAQLIHELWGDESEDSGIQAEDIILLRNHMAHVSLQGKLPIGVNPTEPKQDAKINDDIDDEWKSFIKEMKRKNISPQHIKNLIIFTTNIKTYMKNLDI